MKKKLKRLLLSERGDSSYISSFVYIAITLRQKILADLEPLYAKHLGLYITPECLENPDIPPMIYCKVNHCVWQDGKWIPLDLAASTTKGKEHMTSH